MNQDEIPVYSVALNWQLLWPLLPNQHLVFLVALSACNTALAPCNYSNGY